MNHNKQTERASNDYSYIKTSNRTTRAQLQEQTVIVLKVTQTLSKPNPKGYPMAMGD